MSIQFSDYEVKDIIGEKVSIREINTHINPETLQYADEVKSLVLQVSETDIESIHLGDKYRMRELFRLSPDAVIPKLGKKCRISRECSSYESPVCDLKEKVKKRLEFRPCWEYPSEDQELRGLMAVIHEAWCNRRIVLFVV